MSRGRASTPETLLAGTVSFLALLAVVYVVSGWLLPELFPNRPVLTQGILDPILWGSLGGIALILWNRTVDRPPFSWPQTISSFAVGGFVVSVLVIAGFAGGFTPNASPASLLSLTLNSVRLVTLVAGIEFARAYLFHTLRGRSFPAAYLATVILFFVVGTPLGQWGAIHDPASFYEIALGIWLPALTLSFAATWLVDFGGIGPSFAYRLPIMAFIWLVPFTPDLPWQATMLIGTITPLVSIPLIKGIHTAWTEQASQPASTDSRRRWLSIVATTFSLLVLILFFTGTFGVRPFVVSGISMEPTIGHGDLAIVQESVDPKSIEVGDVLKFRQGELGIVHRVVAIEEGPLFVTQGDNVNRADRPVSPDQVDGKVVLVIPEIGNVALWLGRG